MRFPAICHIALYKISTPDSDPMDTYGRSPPWAEFSMRGSSGRLARGREGIFDEALLRNLICELGGLARLGVGGGGASMVSRRFRISPWRCEKEYKKLAQAITGQSGS